MNPCAHLAHRPVPAWGLKATRLIPTASGQTDRQEAVIGSGQGHRGTPVIPHRKSTIGHPWSDHKSPRPPRPPRPHRPRAHPAFSCGRAPLPAIGLAFGSESKTERPDQNKE